ncbi:FAD-linked oxidase C-terminal domain-containing protein, partial [Neisseria sp. P0018.S006]|uniref:FAD-linked oxidase C-terminal domain-containing protein n=1 Tax=Neisseria sp. P0018.S006 TaxID=3436792 RepID=UPI003F81979E
LTCRGTIAAEHGVCISKKHWLPRVRTQAELVLMHAIKNQLDPYCIRNPDKLLPSLD